MNKFTYPGAVRMPRRRLKQAHDRYPMGSPEYRQLISSVNRKIWMFVGAAITAGIVVKAYLATGA